MHTGQTTVKEILEKKLGEQKAAVILKEIDGAYRGGKRGEDLQEYITETFKKEGLDAENLSLVVSHMVPTS